MWKQRSNILKNSNCNLLSTNSHKSKILKNSDKNYNINEIGNININSEECKYSCCNKNEINNNSKNESKESNFDTYFKVTNPKNNTKGYHVKRMISEDEFFDN